MQTPQAPSPQSRQAPSPGPHWIGFDADNPPPEGAYWVLVNYPEYDGDVDNDGRMVGMATGEVIRHVALARFNGVQDSGPEFEAVDHYLFGGIPDEGWITHYCAVTPPYIARETGQGGPAENQLAPCHFCGGGNTVIREHGRIWLGQKYSEPSSVSVLHHCKPIPGQPSRPIERLGRDRQSAIDAWNMRAQPSE